MNKIVIKVIGFCGVLAVIAYILILSSTNNNNKNHQDAVPQNNTPKKVVQEDNTPISISSEDIEEENFSGSMPIISGSSLVATSARAYIEKRIAEFRTLSDKDVPGLREEYGADNPTASFSIDIGAEYIKSEKTESIAINIYIFTGGAHGNTHYKVFTASRPTGEASPRILSLSDVIKKDKQTSFTKFVQNELNNWQPDGAPVVFPDDVNDLTFASFTNWSLDDEDLTIYFDQNAIGPGYLGAVAFPFPILKIKDFTK